MKHIIESPGDPYMIEDRTTPVFEATQHNSRLWLSLHEAWSVTGELIPDIVESACTQTPAPSGLQFGWPGRAVLTAYLPSYKVVPVQPSNRPRPVLASFAIMRGATVAFSQDIAYHSMMEFRICNELSRRRASCILAHHVGWQQQLPPLMINAVLQAHGWTPPGGWASTPGVAMPNPLFELRYSRGWIYIKYIGPSRVRDIVGLPSAVLANSR